MVTIPVHKSVVIEAAPDEVWSLLSDPKRLTSCLPGASLRQGLGDGSYAGTVKITVGPIPTSYDGTVRFDRIDAHGRSVELTAEGGEASGHGTAGMRMTASLHEVGPARTDVQVASEVSVTGFYTQFGRAAIREISELMLQKFADAIRDELEAGGGREESRGASRSAKPISAISVGAAVGKRALGRLLARDD